MLTSRFRSKRSATARSDRPTPTRIRAAQLAPIISTVRSCSSSVTFRCSPSATLQPANSATRDLVLASLAICAVFYICCVEHAMHSTLYLHMRKHAHRARIEPFYSRMIELHPRLRQEYQNRLREVLFPALRCRCGMTPFRRWLQGMNAIASALLTEIPTVSRCMLHGACCMDVTAWTVQLFNRAQKQMRHATGDRRHATCGMRHATCNIRK